MIDSYWDLYVAYVDKCAHDNWINDIDPHHYEMEWNHTLPQNLFGDQTPGQYLTIRQHAIASALQTLALRKNCMCGWHKKYLPKALVGLAWPYYTKMCADNGKENVGAMLEHPNTAKNRDVLVKKNGEKSGAKNIQRYNQDSTRQERSKNAKSASTKAHSVKNSQGSSVLAASNGSLTQSKKTSEQRVEEARRRALSVNSQKWMCLVTGHVSNPGSLTRYQKARGIDTKMRIRL
jgi:hypothetical protein